jgi:hypothetical protein
MLKALPGNPMQEAREALKRRGCGKDDQEALLVIAALIANYPYGPAEVHAESIHSLWYYRIVEIWRTPPGFRYPVFENILRADYRGTEYGKTYHEALREALGVFLPEGLPARW